MNNKFLPEGDFFLVIFKFLARSYVSDVSSFSDPGSDV